MATATQTRRGSRVAPKAPAKQVTYPKFEIPAIESAEEMVSVLDELVEFVQLRKGMAQDANKAQYWNGQVQALRQLRNLAVQLVPEAEEAS
jgi:hypothetical protein